MNFSHFLSDESYAIFLLHGVVRKQRHTLRNYTRKHLPLDDFVTFLSDLSRHGTPVSMNQILHSTQTGEELPPRAYAITFDDGFENNLNVAAPVLDDFRVPATFYVTTGFVETGARSWTDIIEAAVEDTPHVRLLGIAPELDGDYISVDKKKKLMDGIRQYVKGHSDIDPYEFADQILNQCGVISAGTDSELDGKLNWNQIRTLSDHPLFTVGGHSHTHRILSFLSNEELEREVATSLRLLKQAAGVSPEHYSYPEGLSHCYSAEVIDTLKKYGVHCCPTAEHGVNKRGDDLFRIKRIFVL